MSTLHLEDGNASPIGIPAPEQPRRQRVLAVCAPVRLAVRHIIGDDPCVKANLELHLRND